MVFYEYVSSPIGIITLVGSSSHLREVHFKKLKVRGELASKNSVVYRAKQQLEEFFAGKRRRFDIPLAPSGTEFQKLVWKNLKRIPFGKLLSYGELAKKIGKPGAARAVGGANNKNPIPLFIPCHRVIGSGGKLTGFRPGLPAKKLLLKLEGHFIQEDSINIKHLEP